MIKLTFRNINNGNDRFTLQLPKVYIDNYDSTKNTSYQDYNNRVTLYENFINPYNDVNVPLYSELSDYPTRLNIDYICENINYLRLRIGYIKLNSTYNKTGKELIGALWYFAFGDKNYSKSAIISMGTTYPYNIMNADANFATQYGDIILGYDDINRVLVSIGRKSFTVENALGIVDLGRASTQSAWGKSHTLSKGESIAYGDGDYPTSGLLYPEDVGKTIGYSLATSIDFATGNSKSLYDYLESGGVIPKYPDSDDNPDYPDGDGDKDSDDIDETPEFPDSVAQTGFVSMYNPTLSQLKSLASFMWSSDFLNVIQKLMANPFECILSLKVVKCGFDKGGTSNVILGNVDTGVACTEITRQYQQIDCGSISVNRYFGNFLDYNPYTSIKIYLPFIGYQDLDVDEVMSATLHLFYNVDLLTGSCVAIIKVTKEINGTNLNSVLYQFTGMCANEIPITGADFSQIVGSLIRGTATIAGAVGVTTATGGSGAMVGSAMVASAIDTVTSKVNVQHGGSLGGSCSVLGNSKPYIIIHRVIPKNPTNYSHLHGVPYNAYKTLSTLKGYTKMQDVFISNVIGTEQETHKILNLLKDGIVI